MKTVEQDDVNGLLRAKCERLREACDLALPDLLRLIGEYREDQLGEVFNLARVVGAVCESPADDSGEPDHLEPATFGWTKSGARAREAARKFSESAEPDDAKEHPDV